MQDIRIAAVTLTPQYLNVSANFRAICEWSTQAAEAGAKLVIFPEGFLSGYDLETMHQTAMAWESPEVLAITRLAEERDIVIGFGLLERSAAGFHVSQFYTGRGVRQWHRKCHLTGWEKKQGCLAGDRLEVQEIGDAKLGTLICYDSAFAAAAETLVRKGAQVLIQPSCHGMWARDVAAADRGRETLKRKEHILKYWRTRAYEYSCYAIYVNHCGLTTHGEWFPNYIGFFGPDGEIIAENTAEGEQMVLADLKAEHLRKCREEKIGHYFALADSRPELYR